MENGDTKSSEAQRSPKTTPASSNIQPNFKSKRTKERKNASDENSQKWGLLTHWKRATRRQQFGWIAKAIGGLIAAGVLAVSTAEYIQREKQFSLEHRPRIEFLRPPMLVGQLSCDVGDNELIRYGVTNEYFWVKNTKSGDAPSVFIARAHKFVPDPPSGKESLDLIPVVTKKDCEIVVKPELGTFALNGGQERMVDMPSAGFQADASRPAKAPLSLKVVPADRPENQTTFQIYLSPVCVYYFDEQGQRHGTCTSYRLTRNGQYKFSCKESPITGQFGEIPRNFCEN